MIDLFFAESFAVVGHCKGRARKLKPLENKSELESKKSTEGDCLIIFFLKILRLPNHHTKTLPFVLSSEIHPMSALCRPSRTNWDPSLKRKDRGRITIQKIIKKEPIYVLIVSPYIPL